MRIAIAGGTGTVGTHVVALLRERGHEAVILSRAAGIDLVSGAGLRAALRGADTLINVASVRAMTARKAVGFFRATTANLLDAARANGVRHHSPSRSSASSGSPAATTWASAPRRR